MKGECTMSINQQIASTQQTSFANCLFVDSSSNSSVFSKSLVVIATIISVVLVVLGYGRLR